MVILKNIKEVKKEISQIKKQGKSIGFVPTMGYLHEGHVSLIKASVRENDSTVLSIFVNPTQFGENEDFNTYPRDIKRDSRIAEEAGVDIVFAPEIKEMYPDGYNTYVNVNEITEKLCGKSRPGHFRGVTTVVNKLFNIVEPDRAYFGQKDAQQVAVIKKMVKDLNMNVDIVTCPIVREKDGLAMSSRNTYLSPEERNSALKLSESLFEVKKMIEEGERDKQKVINYIVDKLRSDERIIIDYVEIVNADTLNDLYTIEGKVLIALAAKVGNTRLIDNIVMEVS